MKTGPIAKMFTLDPKTIVNWVERFSELFSDEAAGRSDRAQRDFNDDDVLLLNTIRVLRQETGNWDVIRERIESGFRAGELPTIAATINTGASPIEQYAKALQTISERDLALQQVEELKHEIAGRDQLIEELREELRNKDQELAKKLLEEVSKREREIGKLEGQIEMLKEMLKGK